MATRNSSKVERRRSHARRRRAQTEAEMFQFSIEDPFSQWADHCSVHGVLRRTRTTIEEQARREFHTIKLSDVFVPWRDATTQRAAAKRRVKRTAAAA